MLLGMGYDTVLTTVVIHRRRPTSSWTTSSLLASNASVLVLASLLVPARLSWLVAWGKRFCELGP